MTVNSEASRGATPRHIRLVSGNPCSNRIGGPLPAMVVYIDPPDTEIVCVRLRFGTLFPCKAIRLTLNRAEASHHSRSNVIQ